MNTDKMENFLCSHFDRIWYVMILHVFHELFENV